MLRFIRRCGASLVFPIALTVVATLALALTPSVAPAVTPGASTAPAREACGSSGAEVLAQTAGAVARRIYAAEEHSAEVESDKRQIETYVPLLRAVESGEQAAIETAVHSLVYSHTHIVRLRVERGSQLLFDEGGPYILAPVGGTLRSHGKTLGHFVFSVQDDLGYVKLVTRFLGVPLVLRGESGQIPVEGLLSPGPATIPDRGPVAYRGAFFQAYSFKADAYPSGRLRVSLLLPLSRSLEAKSCTQIKTEEVGLVAQRISRRFTLSPTVFAGYVTLVQTMTHGLVYIRSGSHTLAGSTHTVPRRLPASGALRWHGVHYEVSSFRAPSSIGMVGVYLLVASS
ncbi:MAG TPA: hypothetical protein VK761_06520 [Solirubrobacteraceae bacterium]|nr:hypothetical protein [Solirubrobacteraceae bacterium]